MSCAVGPGANGPPWLAANHCPVTRCTSASAAPKSLKVRLDQCRQQLHKYEMGDVLHLTLRRRWQGAKGLRLGLPAQSGAGGRHRHDATP